MIPYGRQHIDAEDIQAVVDVLKSDWLTTGPKVGEFERYFADFVGAKYAIAVNTGSGQCRVAETAYEQSIILPMYARLTNGDLDKVIARVRETSSAV